MPDAKKRTAKKKKKYRPMQKFVSVFLFLFACFFTYQSAKEIITTIQLKQEISENEQRIEDLKEQQVKLEEQKAKFSDEEYVKRYARGKYLLSKEGETLYKLNDNEPDTENSEDVNQGDIFAFIFL